MVKSEKLFSEFKISSSKDAEKVNRALSNQESFYFYDAIGHPTGEKAVSLTDFAGKIETINLSVISFHFYRGDFERWIRNTLNDPVLASRLCPDDKQIISGESLRRFIADQVRTRLVELNGISVELKLNLPIVTN